MESKRRKSWRIILVGAFFGAVATAAMFFAIGVFKFREGVPALTEEAYRAAVARWEKNGPQNYSCEIEVTGNRPGVVLVDVRGGEVIRMLRDGVEPSQRRTWDFWSVDGQLEAIGQELEMIRDPEHAFGAPAGSRFMLSAQFDPELGYPRVYRRSVSGAQLSMGWKITRFETK